MALQKFFVISELSVSLEFRLLGNVVSFEDV